MKRNAKSLFLLVLLLSVVVGCAGKNKEPEKTSGLFTTDPMSVSLNKKGNYVNNPLDPDEIARIQLRLPMKKLRELFSEEEIRQLPVIFVCSSKDRTNHSTISSGALTSDASPVWMRSALSRAGFKIAASINDYGQQLPFVKLGRLREYLDPEKPLVVDKASMEALIARSHEAGREAARMKMPFSEYSIVVDITRLEMNIASGGMSAEADLGESLYDGLAVGLGFEGIYQVSEVEISFEVWHNADGYLAHSFSLSKQVIAGEKSYVAAFSLLGLLSDDIDLSAVPKKRSAEAMQDVQRRIIEEGAYEIGKWFRKELADRKNDKIKIARSTTPSVSDENNPTPPTPVQYGVSE